MPFQTKLAQLIARREGFGVPGTKPTRFHNPMDLRHGPHVSHEGLDPNAVGIEPDDDTGEADSERQLQLWAGRGLTMERMVCDFLAPPNENDSQEYLDFLCEALGVQPDTPVSEALLIPASV